MMTRIKIFTGLLMLGGLLLLEPALAQNVRPNGVGNNNGVGGGPSGTPPGQGGTPPGQGGTPPGMPIDGGASWLAAAGAAYGIKKYRDYRKNQEADKA